VEGAAELDVPMVADELEVLFCVFDVVVVDGRNLLRLPLRERHVELAGALKPAPEAGIPLEGGATAITARLVTILPDQQPALPSHPKSALWSVHGTSAQAIVVRLQPLALANP
jgi:ATP-dependent DNA ligase